MPPTIQQQTIKWNNFSTDYNKMMSQWALQSATAIITNMNISTAKNILDIGVGPGNVLFLFKSLMSKDATFTGIDLSSNMIDIAKNLVINEINNKEDIWFQPILLVENCLQLSFEDNSFDRVFSNLVLNQVPDIPLALSEIRRVLQPNGILAFSIWGTKYDHDYFELFARGLCSIGKDSNSLRSSNYDMSKDYHIVLKKQLETAGFMNMTFTKTSNNYLFLNGEEYAKHRFQTSKETCLTLNEDERERLWDYLVKESQSLIDNNIPIGLDVLLCIAW